jgi:hypothetical protein
MDDDTCVTYRFYTLSDFIVALDLKYMMIVLL